MKNKTYLSDVTESIELTVSCAITVTPPGCSDGDDPSIPVHNHDTLYYRKDYIDNLFQNITAAKQPVTFKRVTLSTGQQEVVITWADYLEKHGVRPVYIDLYEITTNGMVQSTSKVYTEDDGLTYRWFVSSESPRVWEVRIYGYTDQGSSEPTTLPNLGFNYTLNFPFV